MSDTPDFHTYQKRACDQIVDTFGSANYYSLEERRQRFLEKSVELFQTLKGKKEEAHQLVEYVFGREKGVTSQEIGGVVHTLSGLCGSLNFDLIQCAEDELCRVEGIKDKVRTKQAGKPRFERIEIDRNSEAGSAIARLNCMIDEVPYMTGTSDIAVHYAKRKEALRLGVEAIGRAVRNALISSNLIVKG